MKRTTQSLHGVMAFALDQTLGPVTRVVKCGGLGGEWFGWRDPRGKPLLQSPAETGSGNQNGGATERLSGPPEEVKILSSAAEERVSLWTTKRLNKYTDGAQDRPSVLCNFLSANCRLSFFHHVQVYVHCLMACHVYLVLAIGYWEKLYNLCQGKERHQFYR